MPHDQSMNIKNQQSEFKDTSRHSMQIQFG